MDTRTFCEQQLLGGTVSALLAVTILIGAILSLRIEPAPFTEHKLLSSVAYWFTILAGILFCALLSAVLLRYARQGQKFSDPRRPVRPNRK